MGGSGQPTMTKQWECIGLNGERMTVLANTAVAAAAYAAMRWECKAGDVVVKYRLDVSTRHVAKAGAR